MPRDDDDDTAPETRRQREVVVVAPMMVMTTTPRRDPWRRRRRPRSLTPPRQSRSSSLGGLLLAAVVAVSCLSRKASLVADATTSSLETYRRYTPRGPNAGKTAIIFRTKVLMKMEMIHYLMKSLRSDRYDIWVLFDVGPSVENGDVTPSDFKKIIETFDKFVARVREKAPKAIPETKIFLLEASMLLDFYPQIPFHHILFGRHTTVGRYFHLPFINMWRHIKDQKDYEYYWVMEDDARVTNDDYGAVFDKYANNTADLITKWREPPYWYDDTDLLALGGRESKDPFSWSVPKRFICQKGEHVERLSRALLDEIHAFVRIGVYAYSEVFSSTICKGLEGCFIHWWNDDGVLGSRYGISDEVVTPVLWYRVLRHNESGKWFHPVKWLGGKMAAQELIDQYDLEGALPMRIDEIPFASDQPWFPH